MTLIHISIYVTEVRKYFVEEELQKEGVIK